MMCRPSRTLLTIAGVLLVCVIALCVPAPRDVLSQKSQETALLTNLGVMRKAIWMHRKATGKFPRSLHSLVEAGYIKTIPVDPTSASRTTWIIRRNAEGDVVCVYSGSEGRASDGTYYKDW